MDRKNLLLLTLLTVLSFVGEAKAQQIPMSGSAQYNSSGTVRPVPSAVITVCSANDLSIPCTSKVTIYSSSAGATLSNPFNADVNGNYQYFISSGTYTETITGVGFQGYTRQVSTGGGGTIGGSITSGQVATGNTTANTIKGNTLLPCGNLPALSGVISTIGGSCITAGSGEVPTFIYTFFPDTDPGCILKDYSPTGTTYCALNGTTGIIDYSGSDAAVVINAALAATSGQGGLYQFANGVYNAYTLTQEVNSGCTDYYAFAIPVSTTTLLGVTFVLQGASATTWIGEASGAAATNGVIFNITPTAMALVSGTTQVNGLWQRPQATGSGCTIAPNAFDNNDFITNITVRFPDYTRGHTTQFALRVANTTNYLNALADWNENYSVIAAGSAPPTTSDCFESGYSGGGNEQHFKTTYAVGCNFGYELGEHSVGDTMTTIYSNWWGQIGPSNSPAVSHPIVLVKSTDQENLNGLQINHVSTGCLVDLQGWDIEAGNVDWFARSNGGMQEINPGRCGGKITYTFVLQGTGTTDLPPNALFSGGGGQQFQKVEGFQSANNGSAIPTSITFSSAYNCANCWVGGWIDDTGGSLPAVISGLAADQNGVAGAFEANTSQGPFTDQFAEDTLAGSSLGSGSSFGVLVRASATAQTYYELACYGSGSSNFRAIYKLVAGSPSTLSILGSGTCAPGDSLKLVALGSNPTYLYAYYNGVEDVGLRYADSSSPITSGYPGMVIFHVTTGNGVSFWAGGMMPLSDGVKSIYTLPMIAPTYATLTNCIANGTAASPSVASCGSAAAGMFSCATNASTATCQINTTAVTALSVIGIIQDAADGGASQLNVTCETTYSLPSTAPLLASKNPGVSFTINLGTVTTHPACFEYTLQN
jgi:hypothetical protein